MYVFSKLTISFRGGHCDYLLWAPEKKLATILNMPSLAATDKLRERLLQIFHKIFSRQIKHAFQ